ncbi:transmembrane protein 272-like isoform X2 [Physella acuta]|uniref:transmembrane protein 272-like isoform X2 n=1 Tax=Physella acuta TaxID=109671 RepID=UPI0027DCA603|nr:transmembrane protein 272-like isoform X2 [Physella acuta]
MASNDHSYQNPNPEDPPAYSERDNVKAGEGLPSYHDSDAPPSYESLYGRVKAAKRDSSNVLTFLKAFLIIILSTIGFTIILGILMAVPIAMIVIGALYKDDCPLERMIPIYLIVAGSFGCVKNLFNLVQRFCKSKEEMEEERKKVNPLEQLVNCFLFAWFIVGCVYIYRNYDEVSYDPLKTDHYCDKTLYLFAFWVTTAVYIIMAMSCCCVVCVGCVTCLFGESE